MGRGTGCEGAHAPEFDSAPAAFSTVIIGTSPACRANQTKAKPLTQKKNNHSSRQHTVTPSGTVNGTVNWRVVQKLQACCTHLLGSDLRPLAPLILQRLAEHSMMHSTRWPDITVGGNVCCAPPRS